MRYIITLALAVIFTVVSTRAADNSRSDTIDILHHHIHLRITDFTNKVIDGHAVAHFKSKMNNVTQLRLDLQGFTVDSVKSNGAHLLYTNNGLVVTAQLAGAMNTGDTSSVTVYYRGVPAQDTQWGGFYWSGNNYAFNLGVAFEAVPHNFGRAWFPCFDNFVERATYSFTFITPDNKMAVSNGLPTGNTINPDGTRTWHWHMNDPVPSYLVNVAVAGYTPVWQEYASLYGPIVPVMLAALPADTTNMKNSFTNLDEALQIFEERFGPYLWEKVGYVAVPFNAGAMEHAGCIAYPLSTLNGNVTYEKLMAHELAHHWFGNLVTCETAGDMWLNEGWAVYAEHIFTEALYGPQAYFDIVQTNHATVVPYAHVQDGGLFPLAAMPLDVTYGTTTYKRGADVAHTLRSYMGDAHFFNCLKSYLDAYKFQHANSADLRDHLTQCSGIDLNHFFDNWVFNAGHTAFWVDSFAVVGGPAPHYDVQVFVRQKRSQAPYLFSDVPIELTFMNAALDTVIRTVQMSGPCAVFTVQVPFAPLYVGCDLREKISDGVVGQNKTITTAVSHGFTHARMNLDVFNAGGASFVRIEHRYAPPDPIKPPVPNLHISDYRHWKVEGVWGNGFHAKAVMQYDGSTNPNGHLDVNLITNAEDSIVLLHRHGVHHPWTIAANATHTIAAPNDKKGFFTVNPLLKGEYAFGIYDHAKPPVPVDMTPDSCTVLSSSGFALPRPVFDVFPNPADGVVQITGSSDAALMFSITDALGKTVSTHRAVAGAFNLSVDTARWAKGIYFVTAGGNGVQAATHRFAVTR